MQHAIIAPIPVPAALAAAPEAAEAFDRAWRDYTQGSWDNRAGHREAFAAAEERLCRLTGCIGPHHKRRYVSVVHGESYCPTQAARDALTGAITTAVATEQAWAWRDAEAAREDLEDALVAAIERRR